jgi:hypothetical protein
MPDRYAYLKWVLMWMHMPWDKIDAADYTCLG